MASKTITGTHGVAYTFTPNGCIRTSPFVCGKRSAARR
jgi:hypothetical protein